MNPRGTEISTLKNTDCIQLIFTVNDPSFKEMTYPCSYEIYPLCHI